MILFLFGHSKSEVEFGTVEEQDVEEEGDEEDSEEPDRDYGTGLGGKVMKAWDDRRKHLEHDYSIAAWTLLAPNSHPEPLYGGDL